MSMPRKKPGPLSQVGAVGNEGIKVWLITDSGVVVLGRLPGRYHDPSWRGASREFATNLIASKD
jgi:hypothetical protein